MKRLTLLIALAIAIPHRALAADPDCASLPNPVYLKVGDTQLNLMKRLGRALRDNTSNPITMVFITSGSCANIADKYGHKKSMVGTLMYIQSVAEDAAHGAWTPASAPLTCVGPAGGVEPDVANSALFNSACTTDPPPTNVNLTQGPTQAYVMAVPAQSTQNAITQEEAYFVFGFGAAGMIMPWIDEAQMFIRTTSKSTLLAWAANIGVPGARWKGIQLDGSPMVVTGVMNGTAAAIGILGAEVYDGNRDTMKALAFRAKGQYAAYYPDSTSTSRDKKNVRDGHYTVWSPTIWMDNIDTTSKAPANDKARYVIDLIAGKTVTPAPTFPMIDIIAAVGLVPECAMGVNRSFEGGELSLFSPAESCVCKYESLVGKPSAACTACTDSCATGVCRNGFCEAR